MFKRNPFPIDIGLMSVGTSPHCPHIFRWACSKFGDHQSPFFVVRVCDRDVCLAYFVSSQRYYYCQLLLVSGLMA